MQLNKNLPIKKSTYSQKLKYSLALAPVLLAGTSANAFLAATDVTTATTGAGGEAVLKEAGIWILGIAVGVAVLVKVISLVKR